MALIDFTLSNARRFYSSMGNPSGVKGLKAGLKKEAIPLKQYHLLLYYKTDSILTSYPSELHPLVVVQFQK